MLLCLGEPLISTFSLHSLSYLAALVNPLVHLKTAKSLISAMLTNVLYSFDALPVIFPAALFTLEALISCCIALRDDNFSYSRLQKGILLICEHHIWILWLMMCITQRVTAWGSWEEDAKPEIWGRMSLTDGNLYRGRRLIGQMENCNCDRGKLGQPAGRIGWDLATRAAPSGATVARTSAPPSSAFR